MNYNIYIYINIMVYNNSIKSVRTAFEQLHSVPEYFTIRYLTIVFSSNNTSYH